MIDTRFRNEERPRLGTAPSPTQQMIDLLYAAAEVAYVPHGSRSTFQGWVLERANLGRGVAGAQLAHAKGDMVTEAYERTDLLDRRRELMAAHQEYALSG